MEIAGSSRPCSGAEHLISHALDALHPGTAQHGEQVAFGALVATRLQGGDWGALREFMLAAGMDGAGGGLRAAGSRSWSRPSGRRPRCDRTATRC